MVYLRKHFYITLGYVASRTIASYRLFISYLQTPDHIELF